MQITFAAVSALASGRWEQIHASLGVAPPSVSHLKHTACPGCGGRDRFRVTDDYHATGGWICSQGGGDTTGGDGFALLQHALNYSASDALKAVARECGIDVDAEIDPVELERRRKIAELKARQAAAVRAKEAAVKRARAIERTNHYLSIGKSNPNHPYLINKDVKPYNTLRITTDTTDRLVIPMYTPGGELTGCQLIFGWAEEWSGHAWGIGDKYIVAGTEKKGSLHWLQSPPTAGQSIAVVEGWATGASLVEPEIGFVGAVAVVFDAGNIAPICADLLMFYPSSPIIIFADDDRKQRSRDGAAYNPGKEAAERAALLDPSRISVRLPAWDNGQPPHWASDFNDWLAIERDKRFVAAERAALAD